jgi:hypothetical protein
LNETVSFGLPAWKEPTLHLKSQEDPVSTKEVVTIVSRALAVYFLAWLLSDLTYLPSHLFSFLHHANTLAAPGGTTYWRDSDLISLSFLLLRIVVLFFAVQWFYRSGPAIQGYFLGSSKESQSGL